MDVLRNAFKMDLGVLNPVVDFSFLNFSVIVFFFCILLMVGVSKITTAEAQEKIEGLTLSWGHALGSRSEVILSSVLAICVAGLWFHFR